MLCAPAKVRFSILLVVLSWVSAGARSESGPWEEARRAVEVHRFSTLFTAHDVRRYLSTDEGLERALAWCRDTGVTKVYLESFRDGYDAETEVLRKARDRFRSAGFEVSGGVTTTSLGKRSNRWNIIACYTDTANQERVQSIFERAAGLFDEIMLDDFWFTECSCAECDAARQARRVVVDGRETTVAGDTWDDYRRELMRRLSQEKVLEPVRRTNPAGRVIIKFPQWYDMFHERGYDVDGQTRQFDRIWVGTEIRDYRDSQWGGTVPYEAFFIMRWLGGIGGGKCGGGWYDWLGTTERTYLEQARQTILGGARESVLFCYGGLQGQTGPRNVEALRGAMPELLRAAAEVRKRRLSGVAAYKPANSPPGSERRVFDFVGMLGLPLVPCHEFPTNAPAAFFSVHALHDPGFTHRLAAFLAAGKPVLITDGLAARLPGLAGAGRPGVGILPVGGDPKGLLTRSQAELDGWRQPLLRAVGVSFSAPAWVALTWFEDGSSVVQNFGETNATVVLQGKSHPIAARSWRTDWK